MNRSFKQLVGGLLLLQIVTSVAGNEPVSVKELAEIASEYSIQLHLLTDQITQTVEIPKKLSRDILVSLIDKHFSNTILHSSEELTTIYVLPPSFDRRVWESLPDSGTNFDEIKKDFGQAQPSNLKLGELESVKQLQLAAAHQQKIHLRYDRVVNPGSPTEAYYFLVRYLPDQKMSLPYERNGELVTGQMEGFSNFQSVNKFLEQNKSNLEVLSTKRYWYLRMKQDPASFVALSRQDGQLEVYLNNGSDKSPLPNFTLRIEGTPGSFQVTTRLLIEGHELWLADSVVMIGS